MNNSTNYFVCPSTILKETMIAAGMTQKELSARTGISEKHISKVINGTHSISKAFALSLQPVLKTPAEFWIKLEADYALFKENKKYDEDLEADKKIIESLNYAYFKNLLNLEDTNDPIKKITILREIFSVSKLSCLTETVDSFAAKSANKASELTHVSAAWVLATEILAQRKLETYTISNFKIENKHKLIQEIKKITLKNSITEDEITSLFAQYGIIFIATPYLKKSNIRAAVKKLNNGLYMIAINDRNKKEDLFWFSLAHEIAHIFCGHITKNKALLSINGLSSNPDIENEADDEAGSYFIPPEDWNKFIKNKKTNNFTIEYISKFSVCLNVCPAIIVGRLQHESIIPYNYHTNLIRKINIH